MELIEAGALIALAIWILVYRHRIADYMTALVLGEKSPRGRWHAVRGTKDDRHPDYSTMRAKTQAERDGRDE